MLQGKDVMNWHAIFHLFFSGTKENVFVIHHAPVDLQQLSVFRIGLVSGSSCIKWKSKTMSDQTITAVACGELSINLDWIQRY